MKFNKTMAEGEGECGKGGTKQPLNLNHHHCWFELKRNGQDNLGT